MCFFCGTKSTVLTSAKNGVVVLCLDGGENIYERVCVLRLRHSLFVDENVVFKLQIKPRFKVALRTLLAFVIYREGKIVQNKKKPLLSLSHLKTLYKHNT